MDNINLHIHTNASDGLYSPEETVKIFYQAGLKTISITDHDTIAGITKAISMGEKFGVEIIPGVEISVEVGSKNTCHVLGYFIDYKNKNLITILKKISDDRFYRNKKILKKLNKFNINIEYSELEKIACKKENIGRPHIAQAIINNGYYKDKQKIFDDLLAKGKPAYVPRFRLEINEAIELIHKSYGIAVLAHPGNGYSSYEEMLLIFQKLIRAGLDGLEVYYPKHSKHQINKYKTLALENNLVITAGTDFHGYENRSQLKIDIPINNNIIKSIKKRREKYVFS